MGSRRSRDGLKLPVAGIVFILLAAATLILGIVWAVLGAMEFGEYANPPSGFWDKVGDVLPIVIGAVVVAAIPAMTEVVLILISRGRKGGRS